MNTKAKNLVSDEMVRVAVAACDKFITDWLKDGTSRGLEQIDESLRDGSIRAAIEAIAPMLAQAGDAVSVPVAWMWERRYSNGGNSKKAFDSKYQAEKYAKDGESLPTPDLVYPLYPHPPHDDGKVAIENIQRYYIHSISDSQGSCWFAEADSDGDWVKWSDIEAVIKEQRG